MPKEIVGDFETFSALALGLPFIAADVTLALLARDGAAVVKIEFGLPVFLAW